MWVEEWEGSAEGSRCVAVSVTWLESGLGLHLGSSRTWQSSNSLWRTQLAHLQNVRVSPTTSGSYRR